LFSGPRVCIKIRNGSELPQGNTNITLETGLDFTAQMNEGAALDEEISGSIHFIITPSPKTFFKMKISLRSLK
jgi:hypothetical protein